MITDGFYETMLNRYSAEVPELKHIDKFMDQYSNPEVDEHGNPVFDGFNTPAAFIQLPPQIDLIPLAMGRKAADIVFSVHIMQLVLQTFDKRTSPAIRAKGYAHKALVDKVQLKTEGFNGEQVATGYNQFGTISWIGLNPDIFVGPYIVDILHFKVRLISDNSRITFQRVNPAPNDIINGDMVTHEDLNPEVL